MRRALAALLAALAVAGCQQSAARDGGTGAPCGVDLPCSDGQLCVDGLCVTPSGTCTSDESCGGDTYCRCLNAIGDAGCEGVCIPWANGAYDPACRQPGAFPESTISLAERCHWQGAAHPRIMVTPIVADLDGDGVSEILFSTYSPDLHTELVAIHGDDCSELWRKAFVRPGDAPVAVADLDGDGRPEIALAVGDPPQLAILDIQGNELARSTETVAGAPAPAIADVDGMAPPEIALGASVFRYHPGQTTLETLFSNEFEWTFWQYSMPTFADVDGDGFAELVTGQRVLDGLSGADKTPTMMRSYLDIGGFPAVADFNGDGKPDLALVQTDGIVQAMMIYDLTHDRVLLGPYLIESGALQPSGNGGPPAVDDLDGDGVPEVLVAGSKNLCAYSLRCAAKPQPSDCLPTRQGVQWCAQTHDESSGVTGATAFDFNGDGQDEVVYRDECWLRIYDGRSGRAIAARALSSGTLADNPVVVDLDRDGHAEIVVSADNDPLDCDGKPEAETGAPWTGGTDGVYVFEDPSRRWMATRGLWSEATYHVSEIGDDLRVPPHETPSWRGQNGFRRNSAGAPVWRTADLTAATSSALGGGMGSCNGSFHLAATICDRGTGPSAAPVPGTFYLGDPRAGGAALCSATTSTALQPGQCETLSCDWATSEQGPVDLWFRADDDGRSAPAQPECKTGNDLLLLPGVTCHPIG
jgi:hypothetical protein